MNFKRHHNKWEGQAGILIATGPSMDTSVFPEAQFQLDIIEQRHAQGKLKVCTVNDACYLAPYTDLIYASDNRWWQRHIRAVEGTQTRPLEDGLSDEMYQFKAELWSKDSGICDAYPRINRVIQDGTTGLAAKPGYIKHGGNSSYQLLNLMYHLGLNPIYITGLDCKNVSNDRTHKNHFFGNHPKTWGQANGVLSWISYFNSIAKPLQKRGVTVINLGLDSAVTAFPKGKIEDYL